MERRPEDLADEQVSKLLSEAWGLSLDRVTYHPVGQGSHHWIARSPSQCWFVIVDDLRDGRLKELKASARLVRQLQDEGCLFVVAGVPDMQGNLVKTLDDRWGVQVLPFVHGESTSQNQPHWEHAREQQAVSRQLGWLHTQPVPRYLPGWQTTPPHFALLAKALSSGSSSMAKSDWALRTEAALRTDRRTVEQLVVVYRSLAAKALSDVESWVVTHGEPDSDNILRTSDGRLLLIDWTTAARAPRERDLAEVLHGSPAALSDYQETAGSVEPRQWALDLMDLHWQLSHIARSLDRLLNTPDSEDLAGDWQDYKRRLAWAPETI